MSLGRSFTVTCDAPLPRSLYCLRRSRAADSSKEARRLARHDGWKRRKGLLPWAPQSNGDLCPACAQHLAAQT